MSLRDYIAIFGPADGVNTADERPANLQAPEKWKGNQPRPIQASPRERNEKFADFANGDRSATRKADPRKGSRRCETRADARNVHVNGETANRYIGPLSDGELERIIMLRRVRVAEKFPSRRCKWRSKDAKVWLFIARVESRFEFGMRKAVGNIRMDVKSKDNIVFD